MYYFRIYIQHVSCASFNYWFNICGWFGCNVFITLKIVQRQSNMQGLTSDPAVRTAGLVTFLAVLETQGEFPLFLSYDF